MSALAIHETLPGGAEITLTSQLQVTPVLQAGTDQTVVSSARVSTGTEADQSRLRGTIRKLLEHGHYSPLEHSLLSVDLHVPNFIAKEVLRHRHFGFSERSQRYVKVGEAVPPVFWVPDPGRAALVQVPFKPMQPAFQVPSEAQYGATLAALRQAYHAAYLGYLTLLDTGVAPEVARATLPGAIYTLLRVSGNVRAWLHFLALRTHDAAAAFPSYPQAEIEVVARAVEALIRIHWPITWQYWDRFGRVPT